MTAKILRLERVAEPAWKKISHNLVRHLPSGIYYARKYKAGKGRLFKTTGETRKGPAQTIADVMVAEWIGGKRLTGRRYRVEDLCDLLLEELETVERRKRTRDRDREMLRAESKGRSAGVLRREFGGWWVDEIDERTWWDWTRGRGVKTGRRLGDIGKYLSKLLTFAFERQIIPRKPKIRNPDPPRTEKPTYTIAQIVGFVEKADPELRDLIVIAAESGVRPHEVSELRWEWVAISRQAVVLAFPETFTKTKKARAIRLSAAAAAVVRRRWKAKGKGPYVFPAPKDPFKPLSDVMRSRLWRRMLARSGLDEGPRFHWLRHTWFTQALLTAGLPLPGVAAYGGNSPRLAFGYMAKDAASTADMASAVTLGLDSEE